MKTIILILMTILLTSCKGMVVVKMTIEGYPNEITTIITEQICPQENTSSIDTSPEPSTNQIKQDQIQSPTETTAPTRYPITMYNTNNSIRLLTEL
jgi:hypothetical protein